MDRFEVAGFPAAALALALALTVFQFGEVAGVSLASFGGAGLIAVCAVVFVVVGGVSWFILGMFNLLLKLFNLNLLSAFRVHHAPGKDRLVEYALIAVAAGCGVLAALKPFFIFTLLKASMPITIYIAVVTALFVFSLARLVFAMMQMASPGKKEETK